MDIDLATMSLEQLKVIGVRNTNGGCWAAVHHVLVDAWAHVALFKMLPNHSIEMSAVNLWTVSYAALGQSR
jgi:hypothetical protein